MNFLTKMKYFKNGLIENTRVAKEILWAQVFNSTVGKSKWFHESVSPGRWAVGYPFLYVLYRILDEIKPNNILELGLGQSSKMTCSYTKNYNDKVGMHCIIEHDEEWKNFFLRGNVDLMENCTSKICVLPLKEDIYENVKVPRYYKFCEKLPDVKWNLVLVDGPWGGNEYSRIDVLDLIPERLAESFAILVDDCERNGELNTCEKIKEKLDDDNIAWSEGVYSGEKDVKIIVSRDLKWLCSL